MDIEVFEKQFWGSTGKILIWTIKNCWISLKLYIFGGHNMDIEVFEKQFWGSTGKILIAPRVCTLVALGFGCVHERFLFLVLHQTIFFWGTTATISATFFTICPTKWSFQKCWDNGKLAKNCFLLERRASLWAWIELKRMIGGGKARKTELN